VLRPVFLACLAMYAVAAAPASAAEVSFGGGGLTIVGAPGEGSRLTVESDANTRATVHDDADGLRPGPGCLGTPREVTCTILPFTQCHPCAGTIDLGDASDTLILGGSAVRGPFLVDAGAGDDVVQIVGAANAIVHGGAGNDTLRAQAESELDGGEGADVLQGDRAFASYTSRTAPVTVTLDGVANDGELGEHDNAATGSVIGGDGGDALTGNGAANILSGRGGDDFLAGEGGDDTIHADAGTDLVEAGAGNDRVEGTIDDSVTCGAGNDVVLGLPIPGVYGDCEALFETVEEPYLTLADIVVSKRRPRVTLGWHEYPGVAGPPRAASGGAEMRYRGKLVARGRFSRVERPAAPSVGLTLTARGRALTCRSARRVRLLVVATAQTVGGASRSAIGRTVRLPRVGACAKHRSAAAKR
jgi:Ca2+-binding RTX toxin-like protein